MAVRLNNNIMVFSGQNEEYLPMSHSEIWKYNIYTGQWSKYELAGRIAPPVVMDACAVAIGADVYMFGGLSLTSFRCTNELWKLTTTTQGYLNWSEIEFQRDVKLPSPRSCHSGWGYAGCLWVFGGSGPFSSNYLNDSGTLLHEDRNNQLLCYDSATQVWSNPQCFGAVPSPRSAHSTAAISEKVWLFGGGGMYGHRPHHFFEFDMHSYTWTQILINQSTPQGRSFSSFTAISDRQLALHGGFGHGIDCLGDTWIFDLPTQTWRQYTSSYDLPRYFHTGSLGVNKAIIIIGGLLRIKDSHRYCDQTYTFHVMLEPKSLEQLAAKMIWDHQRVLLWECLPPKLIAKLDLAKSAKISQRLRKAVNEVSE